MHRILISVALIAAPAWSLAQSRTAADVATQPVPAATGAATATASSASVKSRNPFGQVMAELTRAAREQAAAARSAAAPGQGHPAHPVMAPAQAPALADADRP